MRKITIDKIKNIEHIEFILPEYTGVYLLVGANGTGKTTLLVCLDRICNKYGFARGFNASKNFGEVDQYEDGKIQYDVDNPKTSLVFRKKTARWAVSPKGKSDLLSNFGFSNSIFIKADSNRIDVAKDEIHAGHYVAANSNIKNILNEIFETSKFDNLMKLRNTNGRGRQATFFYVIRENNGRYYSEKRFSTGELAILRLVEKLVSVENNTLVLLDEAEMALHPKIQKNLLDYLKGVAEAKKLTVIISTHSVTMIKATDKQHIMLLEDNGKGQFEIINPCYPAKAIGSVDFMDNIIYDAIFFVEDDMARLILKKMLKKCAEVDHRFTTITNCIVSVGGYEQTALLALNTKRQLHGRSKVFAVWDQDVFTDTIPKNKRIENLYNQNKTTIYGLGCTPEIWMVQQLERLQNDIVFAIKEDFNCDVGSILRLPDYMACKSTNPRKLAKQKMDIIIKELSDKSGDQKELVIDKLAQIIIDKTYTESQIKEVIAPMLAQVQ